MDKPGTSIRPRTTGQDHSISQIEFLMACLTSFCVVGVEDVQIYDIFFVWAEFHIYLLRAPLLKEGLKDQQLLPLLFALCFLFIPGNPNY